MKAALNHPLPSSILAGIVPWKKRNPFLMGPRSEDRDYSSQRPNFVIVDARGFIHHGNLADAEIPFLSPRLGDKLSEYTIREKNP
jgi:hypothetical protein